MKNTRDRCRSYIKQATEGLVDRESAGRWEEHFRSCARCRRVKAACEGLEAALRRTSVPRLSGNFSVRLQQRLRSPGRARALSGAHRNALRLYWAAASAAGCYILWHTAWPAELNTAAWLALCILGAVAMAPWLFLQANRRNLVEVLLRILE